MNRTSALVLAAAALAATASHAGDISGDISADATPFVGTRSRAEVQAELVQFKQSGPNVWATSYNQLAQFQPQRSRGEVKAEFLAARGQVEALGGEDSGSRFLVRSRAARADATRVAAQTR
jgi:hypothetical protein